MNLRGKKVECKDKHIKTVIKMLKVKNKEETVKSAREKLLVMCKGNPIRVSADFSAETL